MNGPTLVVLAAGMGSRFGGGGLKQIAPLGPDGEIILDYSVFDAARAGFSKVVFVIKREMEATFRALIDGQRDRRLEVAYAFQELTDLPDGFPVPEGRVKPWGTGHAVWAARGAVSGPFAVVGSDDFFGRDTFEKLYGFTASRCVDGAMCMVHFRLGNTLAENGAVSRGVCEISDGLLRSVTEREQISRASGGQIVYRQDGTLYPLAENTPVSMNVWGFPAGAFRLMEDDLRRWLAADVGDPLKREYYLPAFVDRMAKAGAVRVTALETASRWYGVTYQADAENVRRALAALHAAGEYPRLR